MKNIGYIVVALTCLLVNSCQSSYSEKLVKEWSNKEIKFPDNPTFTIYGEQSTDFTISGSNYKVLTYIDSIGCSSCKLNLSKWKEFMSEVDSISHQNTSFLFFLHPNNTREIKIKLKDEKFDYPMCFDNKDELNKRNKFPHDLNFQTFLLDSTNKVILIGNPIYNHNVRQLYLDLLKGIPIHNKSSKQYAQIVFLDDQSIKLGFFNWEEKKDTCIQLVNKGPIPLIVYDVTTSCECTLATPLSKEINVNDTLRINVSYKAEHPEAFERNVLIHCNTKNSPVEFILEGEAV